MSDEMDFASDGPSAMPEAPSYDFLEYDARSGPAGGTETWRVERGTQLIADFELDGPEDLPRFHEAMVGQQPAWEIVQRLYAIAPMLGVEDPDLLRAWSIEEIAEKRICGTRDVESYVAGAKNYWRRWRLQASATNKKEAEPVESKPALPSEKVEQLLREQGFVDVDDVDEQNYIATRITELEEWLGDDHVRASTRSAIQQEVQIVFVIEPAIRKLRKNIKEQLATTATKEQEARLLSLIKARSEAQTALESTLKAIGVTDGQGGGLRKKLAFNDCLSTCVDAMRDYYAKDDRRPIDKVFTAAEVEILTTPTALRPAQYRPDVVVSAIEAMEHLWDPEYKPTPLGRRVCRKLHEGFKQGVAMVRAEGGEVGTDELEAIEDLEDSTSGGTVMPTPEATAKPADGSQPAPAPQPRIRRTDDVAVIMT
jgi:hypothetical protein